MTDETMITRVATAMKVRREELTAQPLSRIWDELAKAAIEAMREPTEAMISEGADTAIGQVYCGSSGAKAVWSNMIAAALEDGK